MDRLILIRLKIERAHKHIHDLESALVAFLKTEPYTIDAKHDPQTGQLQYCVVEVKETPSEISLISADVLQNLRAALDHLAWQLVLASGNEPDSSTGFPISDTLEKYKTESLRKIKLMREAAKDGINATKPYKGGNDLLWRLHKLNALEKHRELLTVGTVLDRFDAFGHFDRIGILPPGIGPLVKGLHWKPCNRKPLKVGDILFTSPSDKVDEELEFTGEIAFNESGICECESLIETLHRMADLVSNIVSDFQPLL